MLDGEFRDQFGVDDGEDDFEWFDAFVGWLKELPEHDVHMLNIERVRDMNRAYKSIVESLSAAECSAKVSCGYGELGSKSGCITVEGREINLTALGCFAYAASLADNTEVYPLENGNVRMAFAFHRFLIPI